MGAKNKKSSLVPYEIDHADTTPIFPLPPLRDAIGVHKKHYPNGFPASKASKMRKKRMRKVTMMTSEDGTEFVGAHQDIARPDLQSSGSARTQRISQLRPRRSFLRSALRCFDRHTRERRFRAEPQTGVDSCKYVGGV